MPEGVVDKFEVIEIEVEDTDQCLVATSRGHCTLELLHEGAAVRQTGQAVARRLLAETEVRFLVALAQLQLAHDQRMDLVVHHGHQAEVDRDREAEQPACPVAGSCERDRRQGQEWHLARIEVEATGRGANGVAGGGRTREQEADGPQVRMRCVGQRDHREGAPRQTEQARAERPLPAVVDQLAAAAPAEIRPAGGEHHDVGDPHERHERQATREGHR